MKMKTDLFRFRVARRVLLEAAPLAEFALYFVSFVYFVWGVI